MLKKETGLVKTAQVSLYEQFFQGKNASVGWFPHYSFVIASHHCGPMWWTQTAMGKHYWKLGHVCRMQCSPPPNTAEANIPHQGWICIREGSATPLAGLLYPMGGTNTLYGIFVRVFGQCKYLAPTQSTVRTMPLVECRNKASHGQESDLYWEWEIIIVCLWNMKLAEYNFFPIQINCKHHIRFKYHNIKLQEGKCFGFEKCPCLFSP